MLLEMSVAVFLLSIIITIGFKVVSVALDESTASYEGNTAVDQATRTALRMEDILQGASAPSTLDALGITDDCDGASGLTGWHGAFQLAGDQALNTLPAIEFCSLDTGDTTAYAYRLCYAIASTGGSCAGGAPCRTTGACSVVLSRYVGGTWSEYGSLEHVVCTYCASKSTALPFLFYQYPTTSTTPVALNSSSAPDVAVADLSSIQAVTIDLAVQLDPNQNALTAHLDEQRIQDQVILANTFAGLT